MYKIVQGAILYAHYGHSVAVRLDFSPLFVQRTTWTFL